MFYLSIKDLFIARSWLVAVPSGTGKAKAVAVHTGMLRYHTTCASNNLSFSLFFLFSLLPFPPFFSLPSFPSLFYFISLPRIRNLDPNCGRQQNTRCIPHEMPALHPRYIMASVRAERRDCRSHWSPFPIYHHLLSSLSHLWIPSETRRWSTSSQGTPQLRQVVSGTPSRPYMETSSQLSAWQMDRPALKRQQPPTCWSMEAGYQAWSQWKSNATVQRLRDYLTWLTWPCIEVGHFKSGYKVQGSTVSFASKV